MRQAREKAGLTIRQVESIMGAGINSLRDDEKREHCNLENGHLIALATLYGVSAEWLLCGDDGLAIMRRRIERLKRRASRKASAA
jgi:transcriptional regulator with XRE-family HTH domain